MLIRDLDCQLNVTMNYKLAFLELSACIHVGTEIGPEETSSPRPINCSYFPAAFSAALGPATSR